MYKVSIDVDEARYKREDNLVKTHGEGEERGSRRHGSREEQEAEDYVEAKGSVEIEEEEGKKEWNSRSLKEDTERKEVKRPRASPDRRGYLADSPRRKKNRINPRRDVIDTEKKAKVETLESLVQRIGLV